LRVVVTGPAEWDNYARVAATLDSLGRVSGLAHGACPHGGLDWQGERWAVERGVPFVRFEGEWQRFGRQAGPIRNRRMHHEFRPDRVIAFHDAFGIDPGGTEDMVAVARAAGTPVMIVSSRGVVADETQLDLFGGPGA
jgi:YspA, cpYpsA-related SLOG family